MSPTTHGTTHATSPAAAFARPCQPEVPGWDWTRLPYMVAVLIGLGSIGRPLARALVQLGVCRFVLVDPKRYGAASVGVQCEPSEVGQPKVDVVAQELRSAGAMVHACADFVEFLEPGLAAGEAVIVESGDRRSTVRASHELAVRLHRPLVSAHVEPTLLTATVRVVDYRRLDLPSCALCGWSPQEFASQQAVHSCAPDDGRPTRSPRALGELAAGWAALTAVGSIVSDRDGWPDGRERLLSLLGPVLQTSEIPARADCACRGVRAARPTPVYATPGDTSLADLARTAGFDVALNLQVSGSGRFALRARCGGCGEIAAGQRWVRDLARPIGTCACGGQLHALPFAAVSSLQRSDLAHAWDRPLAALGVGDGALIELSHASQRVPLMLVPVPEGPTP